MQTGQARPTVLRNPRFLLLWSAQAISQTALNVITFVLLIEVSRITRSSTQASLVVLAFILPAVVVGPVAGVIVDRTDKRKVLLTTNLLRAFMALSFMIIGAAWPIVIILVTVYLLSVLFSTISQFFSPAEAATIPLLVPGENLAAANSLFSLTFISSQVVGFALLGPLLVKLTTARTVFVVVSVLYFVCSVLVALLPRLPYGLDLTGSGKRPLGLKGTWREILELWLFMTRERAIAAVIVDLSIATAVFLMLATLGVGLVNQVMGLPASDLSYVLAAGGVGTVVGLFLVPRLARRVQLGVLISLGLGTMGACILGMALVQSATQLLPWLQPPVRTTVTLLMVMLFAAILGLGTDLVTVPSQTLLQQRSPLSLRGRVFATLFAFTAALSLVPVLFTGVLADLIGPQKVMALIGLLTIALAVLGRSGREATLANVRDEEKGNT